MRFGALKRLKTLIPHIKRSIQYLKEKIKEKLPGAIEYGADVIKKNIPKIKETFDEKVVNNPNILRYLTDHDRTGLGERALKKVSDNITSDRVDFLKNQLNTVMSTVDKVPSIGFRNLVEYSESESSGSDDYSETSDN